MTSSKIDQKINVKKKTCLESVYSQVQIEETKGQLSTQNAKTYGGFKYIGALSMHFLGRIRLFYGSFCAELIL